MEIFWKSEEHYRDYKEILHKMKREGFDPYYTSFAYLVAATGKGQHILRFVDYDGISYAEMLDGIKVYSTAEISMLKFALHLFNDSLSDITFHEAVKYLDSVNYNCVIHAIEIRYGEYKKSILS